MPILTRVVSFLLRIGEIAFAAVVAGLIGWYLDQFDDSDTWPDARWIYTEVVAGVSIILGLIWLIPFAGGFINWPLDLLISFAWFAAFGLLVDALHKNHCGEIWYWRDFSNDTICDRWRAAEAFSFLSAVFWIVSALLGIWFIHRTTDAIAARAVHRRRWYRHYPV